MKWNQGFFVFVSDENFDFVSSRRSKAENHLRHCRMATGKPYFWAFCDKRTEICSINFSPLFAGEKWRSAKMNGEKWRGARERKKHRGYLGGKPTFVVLPATSRSSSTNSKILSFWSKLELNLWRGGKRFTCEFARKIALSKACRNVDRCRTDVEHVERMSNDVERMSNGCRTMSNGCRMTYQLN